MRMTDFIVRESISAGLTAVTKEGAIREMVENLRGAGYFRGGEAEEVVRAIQKRELLGSTGIGRGVAIPHAKHPGIEKLVGTVGLSRTGIPFDSIDTEPVHVLFMLISPNERPSEHLRALEWVSRALRDDTFVRSLRQASTPQQIWDLLVAQDNLQGG